MLAGDFTDGLPAFFIGQLRYRAGIDNAEVGCFAGSCFPESVTFQQVGQRGGLGKIQFASQGEIGGLFVFEYAVVNHTAMDFPAMRYAKV